MTVSLFFCFAPPRFLHLPRLLTSWFLGQTGSSSLPPYTKYTKQAEASFAKLSKLIYHLAVWKNPLVIHGCYPQGVLGPFWDGPGGLSNECYTKHAAKLLVLMQLRVPCLLAPW